MAAVREELGNKVGATTSVLFSIVQQMLNKYGVQKAISKTTLRMGHGVLARLHSSAEDGRCRRMLPNEPRNTRKIGFVRVFVPSSRFELSDLEEKIEFQLAEYGIDRDPICNIDETSVALPAAGLAGWRKIPQQRKHTTPLPLQSGKWYDSGVSLHVTIRDAWAISWIGWSTARSTPPC